MDPELKGCDKFGSEMVHLPQTRHFFLKKPLIYFHVPLLPPLINFSCTSWLLSSFKVLPGVVTGGEGILIELIVNNFPAHPHIEGLEAVELAFLSKYYIKVAVDGPGSN